MGKVLAQGDDFLVVEGVCLRGQRSHALKLLSKSSPRFHMPLPHDGHGGHDGGNSVSRLGPRAVSQLLAQCLEEVYEGPNHVCLVMHWGSHELDHHHGLAVAVLEALRLLREVMPQSAPLNSLDGGGEGGGGGGGGGIDALTSSDDGLMLSGEDMRKLIERLSALDSHLQAHLFI